MSDPHWREVREALGRANDERRPVSELVSRIVERNQQLERVAELAAWLSEVDMVACAISPPIRLSREVIDIEFENDPAGRRRAHAEVNAAVEIRATRSAAWKELDAALADLASLADPRAPDVLPAAPGFARVCPGSEKNPCSESPTREQG